MTNDQKKIVLHEPHAALLTIEDVDRDLVSLSEALVKEHIMIQQVDLGEAQVRLLDLVDAALKGMTVLIAKDDQQAVQLVPVTQPAGRRLFGSARGLITMADDFDAPLLDFSEYMA